MPTASGSLPSFEARIAIRVSSSRAVLPCGPWRSRRSPLLWDNRRLLRLPTKSTCQWLLGMCLLSGNVHPRWLRPCFQEGNIRAQDVPRRRRWHSASWTLRRHGHHHTTHMLLMGVTFTMTLEYIRSRLCLLSLWQGKDIGPSSPPCLRLRRCDDVYPKTILTFTSNTLSQSPIACALKVPFETVQAYRTIMRPDAGGIVRSAIQVHGLYIQPFHQPSTPEPSSMTHTCTCSLDRCALGDMLQPGRRGRGSSHAACHGLSPSPLADRQKGAHVWGAGPPLPLPPPC